MTNRIHAAILLAPTTTQNDYGALEHTFKSIAQCWVALEFLSTREETHNEQTRSVTRYRVVMRPRGDVRVGWQLHWRGQVLRVVSVDGVSSPKHLLLEAESRGF